MIPKGREDAIRLLILKTLCWDKFPTADQWVLEEAWVKVMRLEKTVARLARQYKQAVAELDLAKHRLDSASKDVRYRMALHKSSGR